MQITHTTAAVNHRFIVLQFLSVNEGKNLPRSKWLRLLADKAVEQGLVEHASHNAVKEILKKTTSSRT